MLLSINPKHVKNILEGNKQYEFRKRRCKQPVDKIVIYATSPVMQVVGEADVLDIIEDSPEHVWSITSDYAGISKRFFDNYYSGREKAVAYKLGRVKQYSEPLLLSDLGINFAPQSFVYLTL
jgi:predicted transcriptional regulator